MTKKSFIIFIIILAITYSIMGIVIIKQQEKIKDKDILITEQNYNVYIAGYESGYNDAENGANSKSYESCYEHFEIDSQQNYHHYSSESYKTKQKEPEPILSKEVIFAIIGGIILIISFILKYKDYIEDNTCLIISIIIIILIILNFIF